MNRKLRTMGWLGTAAIAAALILPAVSSAATGPSVVPTAHEGNITTCPSGTTIVIDGPKAADPGTGSAGGVTVDVTYSNSQTTVAFVATGGVVNIAYIKGGDNYNEYNYGSAGTTADSGLVAPLNNGDQVPIVSHSVFCVTPTQATPTEAPTATPTDAPTATPTDAPTATPTDAPTATPVVTPAPEVTPTPSPAATPSGTVAAETGTPVTPPPTDTIGSGSSSTSSGLPLILAAVAALILAVLFVTPSSRRSRR